MARLISRRAVEQHNGAQLAIFDVTDPAKIKGVASVPVKAPGAFEFVRYLNDRTELVRFRASGELAELDLRQPKNPNAEGRGFSRQRPYLNPS
jgi:hypothetical protein